MGVGIGEIRPSITIEVDKNIFEVIDCTHIKQANRRASCMARVRNLRTGQTLDMTLRDSDNFSIVDIDKRKLQFSYHDGDTYHFMDMDTYEDFSLNRSRIADKAPLLKDNQALTGRFYNDEFIDLELPMSLVMKIVETEPGYKGDTVKAGTKPAKTETGMTIQVPLFINAGESIKIDTRSGGYIERA